MGGAPALLTPRRWLGVAAVGGLLVLWGALGGSGPDVSEPLDVAWVAVVLIPATLGVVWLLLPLARARGLLAVAVALGVLAVLLDAAGADALFNVAKLAAYAFVGFWFLELFLELSWVVLVAAIVPVVDSLSVWRGPTNYVVSEEPGLFDRISIAFRLPGEESTANLGPPDVLFFALFLATAARFALRTGWTWLAMTALLSLTLAATAAFDIAGLPALPAVCLGFLVPNADLLVRALRRRPDA